MRMGNRVTFPKTYKKDTGSDEFFSKELSEQTTGSLTKDRRAWGRQTTVFLGRSGFRYVRDGNMAWKSQELRKSYKIPSL